MRRNRPSPEKTVPRLSFILRLAIRFDPVFVAIHSLQVRFILMPLHVGFTKYVKFLGACV